MEKENTPFLIYVFGYFIGKISASTYALFLKTLGLLPETLGVITKESSTFDFFAWVFILGICFVGGFELMKIAHKQFKEKKPFAFKHALMFLFFPPILGIQKIIPNK
jgi:hypothetical protein